MARPLQGYITALKAEASAAATRSGKGKPTGNSAEFYKPLATQIEEILACAPARLRDRAWSMEDFVSRLQGRYRARPHAADVGHALRALGWVRLRDWTNAGAGRRYWLNTKRVPVK